MSSSEKSTRNGDTSSRLPRPPRGSFSSGAIESTPIFSDAEGADADANSADCGVDDDEDGGDALFRLSAAALSSRSLMRFALSACGRPCVGVGDCAGPFQPSSRLRYRPYGPLV